MKASKELEKQLSNLSITGSMYLNAPLKNELSNLHKEVFGEVVNINCATCVLRAAHKLNTRLVAVPILQKVEKIEPLKVEVKAVNDFETWTRSQLLDYATDKGLVFPRNIKTKKLIALLEECK
jgi:hypothetical protein